MVSGGSVPEHIFMRISIRNKYCVCFSVSLLLETQERAGVFLLFFQYNWEDSCINSKHRFLFLSCQVHFLIYSWALCRESPFRAVVCSTFLACFPHIFLYLTYLISGWSPSLFSVFLSSSKRVSRFSSFVILMFSLRILISKNTVLSQKVVKTQTNISYSVNLGVYLIFNTVRNSLHRKQLYLSEGLLGRSFCTTTEVIEVVGMELQSINTPSVCLLWKHWWRPATTVVFPQSAHRGESFVGEVLCEGYLCFFWFCLRFWSAR